MSKRSLSQDEDDILIEKLLHTHKKLKSLEGSQAPPPSSQSSDTTADITNESNSTSFSTSTPYPKSNIQSYPPPPSLPAPQRTTFTSVINPEKNVYVSNLSKKITSDDIRHLFQMFGFIVDIRLPKYSKHKNRFRFCHVEFENKNSVDAVLNYPHPLIIKNCYLITDRTYKIDKTEVPRCKWISPLQSTTNIVYLYVSGVDWTLSAHKLARVLGSCMIQRIDLEPHEGGHTGRGTIGFFNYNDATRVYLDLQNIQVWRKKLVFLWHG